MLPEEVWIDGRREKLPRMVNTGYDYLFYRAAYEITCCLEKWLNVSLDYDQTFLPALLMLNPLEGPVWMHPEQGQEIGDIRRVVRETRKALKLVRGSIGLRNRGELDAADADVERALTRMRELPPPVATWIDNANCENSEEWLEFLEAIFDLFRQYANERKGRSGHQRARTVALVVRALYDIHAEQPVTIGVTEGVPQGEFGKCIQEVFSWAGIPVNFYRYALEAWSLQRDNPQLCEYRNALLRHNTHQQPAPLGPIVYSVE